jgi:hypothetical protein
MRVCATRPRWEWRGGYANTNRIRPATTTKHHANYYPYTDRHEHADYYLDSDQDSNRNKYGNSNAYAYGHSNTDANPNTRSGSVRRRVSRLLYSTAAARFGLSRYQRYELHGIAT